MSGEAVQTSRGAEVCMGRTHSPGPMDGLQAQRSDPLPDVMRILCEVSAPLA